MFNNRPINFRAWDQERKQMYMVGNIMIDEGVAHSCHYSAVSIFPGDPTSPFHAISIPNNDPLMQFTGIYDSNGREVWEGDVCEFYVCPSVRILERCVFENGQFCLSTYSLEFVTYNYDDSFKVLGNIFENPELLNNNDLLSSSTTWQKPGETA